jgi:hypothetical protein
MYTAVCPSDPGEIVWLERQIARCERVAIIGMFENGRKQLQLRALHAACRCAWHLFCRHLKCNQSKACHGIQAAVTSPRRAPMPAMLPEAPVASREGTSLPGYLTCLTGRAA